MKGIYIEWRDSAGHTGTLWGKKGERLPSILIRTLGVLISEDEEVVRICMDRWTDDEGDEAYRQLEAIVKTGIVRREEWEIGEGHPARMPAYTPPTTPPTTPGMA